MTLRPELLDRAAHAFGKFRTDVTKIDRPAGEIRVTLAGRRVVAGTYRAVRSPKRSAQSVGFDVPEEL